MPIAKEILSKLEQNEPSLVELDLSYLDLTSSDIEMLCVVLKRNNFLHTLNLSGNPIGDENTKLLASLEHVKSLVLNDCRVDDAGTDALAKNKYFTSLNLTGNEIGSAGVHSFRENKTLTSLTLIENHIEDEGAIALAQNASIETLNLAHNKIGIKGAQALAKNAKLKTLNLNYNDISADGAKAFAENVTLIALHLSGNKIGTDGILALAKNTALETLELCYNEMIDEGVIALAQHPTLVNLELGYNMIGFRGANALSRNRKLRFLGLSHNEFGDTGVVALAQNKTLLTIDLSGNRIEYVGAQALSLNNTLEKLILSNNLLKDAGAIVLARNIALQELYLSYNHIGDTGAIALADNITLKMLNLNYNNIGPKGRQALSENVTLKNLILSLEQPPEFTAENLDAIFSLSQSYLCITSLEGVIQFFNPAFARALGYRDDEILTKSIIDFMRPNERELFQKHNPKECKYDSRDYVNHYQSKDGSYRMIRWSSKTKYNRVYWVGLDITEYKKTEREYNKIQEKNTELRIKQMQEYAQQQKDFIAHLSHEVRNPLNAVYGVIELLSQHVDTLNTQIRKLLPSISGDVNKSIDESIVSMQSLINDLKIAADHQLSVLNENLDYATITDKKTSLKSTVFNPNKIVDDVIALYRLEAKQKNLEFETRFPSSEIVFKGDSARLRQIVTNLVGNAVKFASKGKIRINVTTEPISSERAHVKIEVADEGIGLTEEEISHLFKRLSRVSTEGQQGFGLGLYLSKQLANLMEGDIAVVSEKGKGSIFTVKVVLDLPSKEEKVQEKPKGSPAFFSPAVSRARGKALIVEDDTVSRKIMVSFLTKAGFECLQAANGLEALAIHEKEKFEVILMDLAMPIMDGVAATKAIRQRESQLRAAKVPIIFVSADVLDTSKMEAFAAGADSFITKPFNREQLYNEIDRLLTTQKAVLAKVS